MPLFAIKEIEEYRLKSGKQGKALIKTINRGKKFMERRYLVRDSIYVKKSKGNSIIKARCKASMKRETRKLAVILTISTISWHFELADYSLRQIKRVPDEVAYTSRSRQLGYEHVCKEERKI